MIGVTAAAPVIAVVTPVAGLMVKVFVALIPVY